MPEVTEEEVRECILSKAGESFGAGNVTSDRDVPSNDLGDLDPEQQEKAIKRARQWCRGLYESTHIESRSIEEIDRAFDAAKSGIEDGQAIEDLDQFRNAPSDETEDTLELDEDSVEVIDPNE